jgi:hypothetical protein
MYGSLVDQYAFYKFRELGHWNLGIVSCFDPFYRIGVLRISGLTGSGSVKFEFAFAQYIVQMQDALDLSL